jgi:hypothetical protein
MRLYVLPPPLHEYIAQGLILILALRLGDDVFIDTATVDQRCGERGWQRQMQWSINRVLG